MVAWSLRIALVTSPFSARKCLNGMYGSGKESISSCVKAAIIDLTPLDSSSVIVTGLDEDSLSSDWVVVVVVVVSSSMAGMETLKLATSSCCDDDDGIAGIVIVHVYVAVLVFVVDDVDVHFQMKREWAKQNFVSENDEGRSECIINYYALLLRTMPVAHSFQGHTCIWLVRV